MLELERGHLWCPLFTFLSLGVFMSSVKFPHPSRSCSSPSQVTLISQSSQFEAHILRAESQNNGDLPPPSPNNIHYLLLSEIISIIERKQRGRGE